MSTMKQILRDKAQTIWSVTPAETVFVAISLIFEGNLQLN